MKQPLHLTSRSPRPSLDTEAMQTLQRNAVEGTGWSPRGLLPFYYVRPARSIYPYQWLWDSCFHAIVHARLAPDLAKAELRSLVAHSQPNGFIPHMIRWSPPGAAALRRDDAWSQTSFGNLTQPAVLGFALEAVHDRTHDFSFARELLPAVIRYYDYLATMRDPDGDGLVAIINPVESGMDHSPCFDAAMTANRPSAMRYHWRNFRLQQRYTRLRWNLAGIFAESGFHVEELAFNCIFAAGLRAVARIAHALADPSAGRLTLMVERTERAILDRCYEPETQTFSSLAGRDEARMRVRTVASLLPLLLPSLPRAWADELVERQLLHPGRFWTPWPVPSVSMDEPTYQPHAWSIPDRPGPIGMVRRQYQRFHMVWRGPTWVNMNWFVCYGLRLHGYDDIADDLAQRTVRLVEQTGFWEFYHPSTGQGLGAEGYSWSALAVVMPKRADGQTERNEPRQERLA